jgi:uncharacterized protein (TIGR03067 family)
MKKLILISLCIAAMIGAGCANSSTANASAVASQPRASALEGTWHGNEVTSDHQGAVSLIFSGQKLDYRGSDENDWAKGTFTIKPDTKPTQMAITITSSPEDKSNGRVVNAIYTIQDGVLKITGNAPGDENFPATLDAPSSRQFVLKHD